MRNRSRCIAFMISCGCLSAATVNYKDLAAARLPYGQAITITGDAKDFGDGAAIRAISVGVTVDGLPPAAPVDAIVSGATWAVEAGPFPRNASVRFDFKITRATITPTFERLAVEQPVTQQVTSVSTVQDFAKYAGIDVGALYAPPVEALRSFFTVNIYLGSVEDTPAPATPCQSACTIRDSLFWQTFQQRFSVTGGVSLGDFSGQKNPPFANNYAYVAGGGWRLNKYFRAFGGDLLYRNKDTDRINHALCFGFLVEFSALGNITSIFGKVP